MRGQQYTKLIGAIYEKFGTRTEFAKAMGMSLTTLSLRLEGKNEFKQSEMRKACGLLDIPIDSICDYFFTA